MFLLHSSNEKVSWKENEITRRENYSAHISCRQCALMVRRPGVEWLPAIIVSRLVLKRSFQVKAAIASTEESKQELNFRLPEENAEQQ